MWKVLPKFGLLKLIFTAFSALLLSALIVLLGQTSQTNNLFIWVNYAEALKIATPVAIAFICLIYVIGKWGWRIFWLIPVIKNVLNKNVCPDLNGTWSGTIESNFLNENGERTIKDVELVVKADFFGFSITQRSLDDYQNSKVVQSEIHKDPRTGIFYISYIFEGDVPIPEESDDRVFDGAGKLEVRFKENAILLLGTYWTNRAWQRRKNTAGIIKLIRKDT